MIPGELAAALAALRERRPDAAFDVRWHDSVPSTMDLASALRMSASAHRVLVKPCERAALEHAIEAGVRISVAELHPTMKALVAGTMRLPSPPSAATW